MGMNAGTFVFSLLTFFVIFIALAYRYHMRELDHKQTMAALEKGVDIPSPTTAPWTPRTYLLHGMIWLFVGIGSFIALSAIAVTSHKPLSMDVKLLSVTQARDRGATPEEIKMLLNAPGDEQGLPVGLGFLGLIPTGVGLAYLLFYRIEAKKLVS
jgi:hypothetical protein